MKAKMPKKLKSPKCKWSKQDCDIVSRPRQRNNHPKWRHWTGGLNFFLGRSYTSFQAFKFWKLFWILDFALWIL